MWFDQSKELLGSVLRITFEHKNKTAGARLLKSCWKEIRRFHNKYSRFIDGNYIQKINLKVGTWQKVDAETFEMLRKVEKLQEMYGLNFNLAVMGSLENFGYDKKYSFKAKVRVRTKAVSGYVKLKKPDLVFISAPIEFGGFGKGYALDLAAEIFKKTCKNICLDFGGDLYAQGKNPEGQEWEMAMESPFKKDEAIGITALNGKFLAASNPLRRTWGNKKQFHHLIDIESGRPAKSWAAAYVLAATGFEADFLATALFCTPKPKLQLLAGRIKQLSFVLVDPKGSAWINNSPAEFF
jgi:thiamine biosynthesis lipoprotein